MYSSDNDGALFSNIDTELTQDAIKDTENVYFETHGTDKNIEEFSYTDIPNGEHFIYVKVYRNRYATSDGHLKFKVRE